MGTSSGKKSITKAEIEDHHDNWREKEENNQRPSSIGNLSAGAFSDNGNSLSNSADESITKNQYIPDWSIRDGITPTPTYSRKNLNSNKKKKKLQNSKNKKKNKSNIAEKENQPERNDGDDSDYDGSSSNFR